MQLGQSADELVRARLRLRQTQIERMETPDQRLRIRVGSHSGQQLLDACLKLLDASGCRRQLPGQLTEAAVELLQASRELLRAGVGLAGAGGDLL